MTIRVGRRQHAILSYLLDQHGRNVGEPYPVARWMLRRAIDGWSPEPLRLLVQRGLVAAKDDGLHVWYVLTRSGLARLDSSPIYRRASIRAYRDALDAVGW
jgi:hypothetical protein